MPEIIDKTLIVDALRFLSAQENGDLKEYGIDTRETTYSAILNILNKHAYILPNGKISKKGKEFLQSKKLTDIFKVEFTPYGVNYSGNGNGYVDKVKKILKDRPVPDYTLDHQPLWPELTAMRAHYIASEEVLFDKNVAMVGDYDSTGLALNVITSIKKMVVFDIDTRLLNFFQSVAKQQKFNMKTVEYNLFNNVPDKYAGKFDMFVTDPPYAMGGMKKFIEFGINLLKDGGIGYIAVPYHENISWTERMLYEVNKIAVDNGCVVTDVLKNFHRYQTADGLRSSMVRIKKGAQKKDIDVEKMYSYKEVNVNIPEIKHKKI